MVSNSLKSGWEGLTSESVDFCDGYVRIANNVIGLHVTGRNISHISSNLNCIDSGKRAYGLALRAFCNWLYSKKSGYPRQIHRPGPIRG
jgi:hypothetical protein